MDPEMSMNVNLLIDLCMKNPAILNDPSIVLLRDVLLSTGDAAYITEESPQPHGEDSDLMASYSDPDIMAARQDGSSEEGQDEMEEEPDIFFPGDMTLEQMINELEKKKDNRIHKRSVIAFIEEIEKAIQYFAFKEQLRKDKSIQYDSPKDDLVEAQLVKSIFDKLGKEDIQHAVDAYIRELTEQFLLRRRTEYLKYYKDFVLGKWGDDNYVYTAEDFKYMEELFPCPGLDNPEIYDRYAVLNPFFKLVYGVLKKGHIMDQNPITELQKIIIANPMTRSIRRVLNGVPLSTSDSGVDPVSTGEEACDLTEALSKYRNLIVVLEDGYRKLKVVLEDGLESDPSGSLSRESVLPRAADE